MNKMDIHQFKLNSDYYYFNQKIVLLRIFEEIRMAKIKFVVSEKERIVDLNGISEQPIFENSICINLLGGEKG